MKCPVHPRQEIVGYCAECGTLGCDRCVKTLQKELLCTRCYRKKYGKLAEEHQRDVRRKKHQKQRLVVRYTDGHILKGTSYTIDVDAAGFHLTPQASQASVDETVFVRFSDVKAVFFVRDFDGKFDKKTVEKEWAPEGSEVTVVFPDSEVIEGFSLISLDEDQPRFHMIPKDQKGNNISIIIERANTAQVHRGHTAADLAAEARHDGKDAPLSQEETLGDFYFETKNYLNALPQYEQAYKIHRGSTRLRRKITLTKYNIAVYYIKTKKYQDAIDMFKEVLREEPDPHTKFHREAKRKLLKLRRAKAEKSSATAEAER